MNQKGRDRERPAWVLGDSAGGTVVGLVFFALAFVLMVSAALIGSVWAWVGIVGTAVEVGLAIASIVWHRRHIPAYDPSAPDGSSDG